MEAAGAADKKCGGVWGGREPPPRVHRPGSLGRASGGEISMKNDKGVMDRPWTEWRFLRAISSTLKCQFTGNHELEKMAIW